MGLFATALAADATAAPGVAANAVAVEAADILGANGLAGGEFGCGAVWRTAQQMEQRGTKEVFRPAIPAGCAPVAAMFSGDRANEFFWRCAGLI
jgi:hypothetical protein